MRLMRTGLPVRELRSVEIALCPDRLPSSFDMTHSLLGVFADRLPAEHISPTTLEKLGFGRQTGQSC